MSRYYHFFFILLILTFSKGLKAGENCKKLIKKIKADSEWNIINYFSEIDRAIKSNCSKEDQISLLTIKAEYYMISDKTDSCELMLLKAKKYNSGPGKNDSIESFINYRLASAHTKQKKYFEAYKEWSSTNNYLLLHKRYKGLANNQIVLGNIFLTLKQDKYALKAFRKAHKYALIDKDKRVLESVYGAFASYWGTFNQWDSSLYYMRLSEALAPIGNIDVSMDYNKGALYLNKGDIDNARLYFNKTILDAKKINCKGYVGVGQYGLAITYLNEDPAKAFKLMKEALDMIDNSNPDVGINICECILDNFEGKEYDALVPFFEKRKKVLSDKKETLNESQVAKLFEVSSSMNEKLLSAQKEIEHKRMKELEQSKRMLTIILIATFIFIFCAVAVYFYYTVSRAKNLIQLKSEQQRKVLNHSVVTITNFNAMSESLSHKLKQMALQQSSKKLSDELYELAKSTDEMAVGAKSKELKDLDLVIQSINDGFVKSLSSKFANLSSNDLTLAIYLRMNFSTKQISELKGTSENSIDVARSRLRAKLGIKGENVDLSVFLNRI